MRSGDGLSVASRRSRREFVDDAKGQRSGEREKVGAMEERCWAQRAGGPGNVDATVLDGERVIQQALHKGEPRLADDRTRAEHLPVRPARWQLARLSQDLVDEFKRQCGNIAGQRGGQLAIHIVYAFVKQRGVEWLVQRELPGRTRLQRASELHTLTTASLFLPLFFVFRQRRRVIIG